jgi:hypothetical protein
LMSVFSSSMRWRGGAAACEAHPLLDLGHLGAITRSALRAARSRESGFNLDSRKTPGARHNRP